MNEKVKKKNPEYKRVALTPLGLLCLGGCIALILIWLSAQIKLTDLTTQNAQLLKSVNKANSESARLKLDYENAFNITAIEREATAKYGMRKATELQTVYIGAESDSKVMLLTAGTQENEGILGKISDILRKLSEYIINN